MARPNEFPGYNIATLMHIQPQRPAAQISLQTPVFRLHPLLQWIEPAHLGKDIDQAHVKIDNAAFSQRRGKITDSVHVFLLTLGITSSQDQWNQMSALV